MRVTRLAGALVLLALLTAGCAGEPTGGQGEVQAATSTAAEATTATTEPATTQPTTTTTTRRTDTTRPTSKPAANFELTIEIVKKGGAEGEVRVNPGDGVCSTTPCHYRFRDGEEITLTADPGTRQPNPTFEGGGGGQQACEGVPCYTFTLHRDTTVTVTFGQQGGG